MQPPIMHEYYFRQNLHAADLKGLLHGLMWPEKPYTVHECITFLHNLAMQYAFSMRDIDS